MILSRLLKVSRVCPSGTRRSFCGNECRNLQSLRKVLPSSFPRFFGSQPTASGPFKNTQQVARAASRPADTTVATSFPQTPSSQHDASQKAKPDAMVWTSGIPQQYDVFIVGGGVTGTALLYLLANFTNIKRIGLVERRDDFATVASGPVSNSQTIHCGDIETNYTLQKARTVRLHADMLRNFGTKLPPALRDTCIFKMPKMVIGVGEAETQQLEERYETFKQLFPKMELINKTKIRAVEPHVVQLSSHRERPDTLNALYQPDEHTGVNYYNLSHAFIKSAEEATDKTVHVRSGTEVQEIIAHDEHHRPADNQAPLHEGGGFTIRTSKGTVRSKFVVVSSCGYSLLMANKLGYGLNYGCLPVAGSFYFSKMPVLNGKVYTVQDSKLPFAAVHGDPDIYNKGFTRFGPTALPMMLLERYNWSSFKDFLAVSRIDLKYLTVLLKMFSDPAVFRFAMRNFIFEIPYMGIHLFLRDVQKVIPGMQADDLVFAKGYGGIRPQLIDKKKMSLILGEGKLQGNNIVFNVTPSPGGTTCLGNGEADMRTVCSALGAEIDEKKLKKTLYEGEYTIDYV